MNSMWLDPEVRRVLLLEIAYQRSQRDGYLIAAHDMQNDRDARLFAYMCHEACVYAIRTIRDVWDALVAVECKRAEQRLSSGDEW